MLFADLAGRATLALDGGGTLDVSLHLVDDHHFIVPAGLSVRPTLPCDGDGLCAHEALVLPSTLTPFFAHDDRSDPPAADVQDP